MTETPNDRTSSPDDTGSDDTDEKVGVEVGMTDEGSTFEPEEDPGAATDS